MPFTSRVLTVVKAGGVCQWGISLWGGRIHAWDWRRSWAGLGICAENTKEFSRSADPGWETDRIDGK